MNFEFVSQLTLISSGFGLLMFIWRKIPQLLKIQDRKFSKKTGLLADSRIFILEVTATIKKISPIKGFSFDLFLQKILSKIRILTLKTDNKTLNWLQKLREKTQNKLKEKGNYWEELKKIKK